MMLTHHSAHGKLKLFHLEDGGFNHQRDYKRTGIKIIIQQRSDEKDVTGYLMSCDVDDEWTKLILPMEFEVARKCNTYINDKLFFQDPRTFEGELLTKNHYSAEDARKDKIEKGSYNWAGQYQQRPAPLEGGILQKSWFNLYKSNKLPVFSQVLQSWDTAISDKSTAAYSACTTWGLFEQNGYNNIMLLTCWRGKVNFTDLRKRAVRLFKNLADTGETPKTNRGSITVNRCIIEKHVTGDPLISELYDAGIAAEPYVPKGDKLARVQIVSPYIEAGLIHILDTKENTIFLDEMAKFPNASSRDYVDTLSQILAYLRDSNKLTIPYDPVRPSFKSDFEIPYFKYK